MGSGGLKVDKKYLSDILDLFLLTFGFASMSMYPDLANTIRPALKVSQTFLIGEL